MSLSKVIVINLDRDSSRLAWMNKQFQGIQFERFSAITPKTISTHISSNFSSNKNQLLQTEKACFASHLSICEKMLSEESSEEKVWLICEDDLKVNIDFIKIIDKYVINSSSDIIRLNDFPKSPTKLIQNWGKYKEIQYSRIILGSGSYLLKKSGARKIINNSIDVSIPYDTYLRKLGKSVLKTSGIHPPPLLQDQYGKSSISSNVVNRKNKRKYHLKVKKSKKGNLNYQPSILTYIRYKLSKTKRDINGEFITK